MSIIIHILAAALTVMASVGIVIVLSAIVFSLPYEEQE